jgi:hypothetical protein
VIVTSKQEPKVQSRLEKWIVFDSSVTHGIEKSDQPERPASAGEVVRELPALRLRAQLSKLECFAFA